MYIGKLNIFLVFAVIFFTACGDETKNSDVNISKNISSKEVENNKTIPQKIETGKKLLQTQHQIEEEKIEQSEEVNTTLEEEEDADFVPLPKSEEELADEKSPQPIVVEDEVYDGPIPEKSEEERLSEATQLEENITDQKSEEELSDEQLSKKGE